MKALDLILSGRKNKKARELITSAEKMLHDVDSEIEKTDSLFEQDLQRYILLRDDVSAHSLKTFDDIYRQIQNVDFKGSILAYSDEKMEDIGDEFCKCKHEIEPVVIDKVNTGIFSAVAGGLSAGLAALAAAVSVALMQTGIEFDFKKIPDQEQITSVLEWFGGGMLQEGSADAMAGGYILGSGVAVVTLIAGYLILNARSGKNLSAAEAKFSEATASHMDKSTQNRKTMSMTEYIETLENNLKTLKVYMDEFNAVLKRIIHIEGTDYAAYSMNSQKDVHTALSIYKRAKSLICAKVVGNEGVVASASRDELEKSSDFLKEMAKKWR